MSQYQCILNFSCFRIYIFTRHHIAKLNFLSHKIYIFLDFSYLPFIGDCQDWLKENMINLISKLVAEGYLAKEFTSCGNYSFYSLKEGPKYKSLLPSNRVCFKKKKKLFALLFIQSGFV